MIEDLNWLVNHLGMEYENGRCQVRIYDEDFEDLMTLKFKTLEHLLQLNVEAENYEGAELINSVIKAKQCGKQSLK